ncbi:MAG: protein TolR [Deltaproteobacteria bacterium]|nr:protein TolR [Deltaproteobacteria bacterium]MBW2200051.1 protein TolR [Deltaproteobacteria bacterium]MBW2538235.1 protein TolR [Deltaproteobacteria bacterium]
MTFGGNSDRLMSDINVTPFVDVMLVLLIIFMVTAPMMMQGEDVSLPVASSDPLSSKQDHLIITIDKKNQVFINNYKVLFDNLKEKLEKILDGRVDREVYLRADKEVSYGMVVSVMSAIKGAGVENLGMVTMPFDQSREKTRQKARKK